MKEVRLTFKIRKVPNSMSVVEHHIHYNGDVAKVYLAHIDTAEIFAEATTTLDAEEVLGLLEDLLIALINKKEG